MSPVIELRLLAVRVHEPEPAELPQPHHLAAHRNQDVLGRHLPAGGRVRPRLRLPVIRPLLTPRTPAGETKPRPPPSLAGREGWDVGGRIYRIFTPMGGGGRGGRQRHRKEIYLAQEITQAMSWTLD